MNTLDGERKEKKTYGNRMHHDYCAREHTVAKQKLASPIFHFVLEFIVDDFKHTLGNQVEYGKSVHVIIHH